jgi:hypothetical protein
MLSGFLAEDRMKHNKKAQAESGPMNTIVAVAIIVLVLGGVFFFIIRAELTKKLSELPLVEEVQGEVSVPDICPFEIGYLKQEGDLLRFYLKDSSEPTKFYLRNGLGWGSGIEGWFVEYALTGLLASDLPVGFVKGTAGNMLISIYCNVPSLSGNKIQETGLLRILHNSYFIESYSKAGKRIVCRKEMMPDDLDSCSDGKRFMNQIEKRIVDSYLLSVKRGNNEIIKIKPECTSGKLTFKRNIEVGVGQTKYFGWENEYGEQIIGKQSDFGSGRKVEFVWDECQKSASAVSTLFVRYPYGTAYPSIERDAMISKSDVGLLLYQKYFNSENYKGCQSEFIQNANEVLKNSNTKDTFAASISKFLGYFCLKQNGFVEPGLFTFKSPALGCDWGGKDDVWTPVTAPLTAPGEQKCSEFASDINYINTALRLSSRSDAGCSTCSSENGYQCRFVTDAGLGNWEDCVPVSGIFCSKTGNKKCVAYEWNDMFEFDDSWTISKYKMQLTEEGLK